MHPNVTVITPTFNRAKFLPETIESVLRQTLTDFEYIILDDGSSDNTQEVVTPYLKDPRVRYLYHVNQGEAETVNWGWSLAKGEYFTQINSDDPVYPNFLKVMVHALKKYPDKILAYPDFDFINEVGKTISTTKGRSWSFLRNLSEFSCEAACPGTMLRRSALADLQKIKRRGFMHINDVEMYWNLALRGDFLHVPHVLATWRMHDGQISHERYKAIPECEEWYARYFSRMDLPLPVRQVQPDVRISLCKYFIMLIENSDLPPLEKKQLELPYRKELSLDTYDFSCLQIGDNDLVGSKFNGHDLHTYLRNKKIDATHIVCNKSSHDQYTDIADNSSNLSFLNSIITNKLFLNSDIIHLHLIHNTQFDILHLPFLSSLKPVVWTLHDTWALGGHCIYHKKCEKWKAHCHDCQYLDTPFKQEHDFSAFEFAKKLHAIRDSQIQIIVASAWMRDKVAASPIWKGKKIHLVPFGINQEIFRPADMCMARAALRIPHNAVVLFARTQRNFKGLQIISEALRSIKTDRPIVLLTVGENGLLKDLPKSVRHREFGWLHDDNRLASMYQACDLFLMPSECEAFGMMAIEAMSCGKMVLALDTPASALPEVINAPDCGVAVPHNAYAQELCRLLDNPDEITLRGRRCLAFASDVYQYDRYVDKIIEIYQLAQKTFSATESARLVLGQLRKYACGVMVQDRRKILPVRVRNYYRKYGLRQTVMRIIRSLR